MCEFTVESLIFTSELVFSGNFNASRKYVHGDDKIILIIMHLHCKH